MPYMQPLTPNPARSAASWARSLSERKAKNSRVSGRFIARTALAIDGSRSNPTAAWPASSRLVGTPCFWM